MSVPSELLMNTQNSFQTHAQRGANIVQRGGQQHPHPPSGFGMDVQEIMGCDAISGCSSARSKIANDQDDYGAKWIQYQLNYIDKYKHRLKQFVANMNNTKGPFKDKIFPAHFKVFNDQFNALGLPKITKVAKAGGKRKSKRTKRMARKGRKSRRKQHGGGRTITFSTLDHMANSRLGKMVPHGDVYTNCNKQSGGGFGFTREGAADAATFKGSYPAFQKYEKSKQCGGRKRRRRKSRKKRRKSRKKSRKSRRKRRRSRRRRRRRGGIPLPGQNPDGTIRQRGGSSASYAAPFAGGEKPWATAPLGIQKNGASCYDNYNHYKGM